MKAKGSNPYNKRGDVDDKKAFKNTEKSVKPVAKDTNATRRKDTLRPLKNKIKRRPFKQTASNEPKNIK
jgi:DNA-nicking Smr family endonuclease